MNSLDLKYVFQVGGGAQIGKRTASFEQVRRIYLFLTLWKQHNWKIICLRLSTPHYRSDQMGRRLIWPSTTSMRSWGSWKIDDLWKSYLKNRHFYIEFWKLNEQDKLHIMQCTRLFLPTFIASIIFQFIASILYKLHLAREYLYIRSIWS